MKTANEILEQIINGINELSDCNDNVDDGYVKLPIYYSTDSKGNIRFEIDYINDLIYALEKHNEESGFDFDE